MRKRFDEQLNELGKEMQTMGMMVEESIQKAIESFRISDEKKQYLKTLKK